MTPPKKMTSPKNMTPPNNTTPPFIARELLLKKNLDRFHVRGDEIPTTNVSIHILPNTIEEIPVNTKQYILPHALKEETLIQVETMLRKGNIRPSRSSYNTSS